MTVMNGSQTPKPATLTSFDGFNQPQLAHILGALTGKPVKAKFAATLAEARKRVTKAAAAIDLTPEDVFRAVEACSAPSDPETLTLALRFVTVEKAEATAAKAAERKAEKSRDEMEREGAINDALRQGELAQDKETARAAVRKLERMKADVPDSLREKANGVKPAAAKIVDADDLSKADLIGEVQSGKIAPPKRAAKPAKKAKAAKEPKAPKAEREKAANGAELPAPGTKNRIMLDLVTRKGGATVGEMCKALGWKACTATLGHMLRNLGVADKMKASGKGAERLISAPWPGKAG